MSVTSILNEVVQNLEENPNLTRIKKVMLCGSQGKWENDRKKLKNISVESLVKELYWKTQNIDKLYHIFDKILSKINKKTEYSLVIDIILEQLSKLYLEVDEAKKENNNIPWLSQAPIPLIDIDTKKASQKSQDFKALFEVRFKLMQHSNPLRVKILIFSAIEQEFSFSSQDWMQLRSISLDQLLQQLIQTFPTLPALESHLKKVSTYLDESDEMLQVATVITDTIKPLYETPQKNYVLSQVFTPDKQMEFHMNLKPVNPPVPELVACESRPKNRPIYQSFQNANLSDIQTLQLVNLDNAKDLSSSDSSIDSDQSSTLESGFISSPSESISGFSDESYPNHQKLVDQLLPSKYEIERRVSDHVSIAVKHVERLLNDLEAEVTHWIQDQPLELQIEMRTQILQRFIDQFQGQVMDFNILLNSPEKSDNLNLDLSEKSLEFSPENSDANLYKNRQNNIMENAKKGDCKAIKALINQSLNPRGIYTLTKTKNSCLYIVLESEEVPNKESTAQFVHKKLMFLKINSIQNIKIYGRKIGEKAIAWVQEFAYNQV